jgi:hypothetical protein
MEKQAIHIVAAFATEADEAEWWYENRDTHGKELLAAVKSGKAQVLAKDKLLERMAASNAKTKFGR